MTAAITAAVVSDDADALASVETALQTVYDDVTVVDGRDGHARADCLLAIEPLGSTAWDVVESAVARAPQRPLVALSTPADADEVRSRATGADATDVVVAEGAGRFETLAHRVRGVVQQDRTRDAAAVPAGTHLTDLYEVATDTTRSFEEKADRMLEIGVDRLGVENAHLSTIDREPERYEIVASVGELPISPGDLMDLPETFCRKTIETDEVLSFSHASEQGWADDPAYRDTGIECYLGSRIVVGERLSGTVCFLDHDPHDTFTEAERTFVSLVARWLSHELERTRRREALDVLHRGTTELMRAQSKAGVCEVAVGITGDMVDAPTASAWLVDDDERELRPVSTLGTDEDLHALTRRDTEGDRLWDVYDEGSLSEYDGETDALGREDADSTVRSEVVVPLGQHGVLAVTSGTAGEFDDIDVSLLGMLGSTVDAALERTERVEELIAANERTRQLFDSVSDALLLVDTGSSEIVDCNDRAVDLLGYEDRAALQSEPPATIYRDDVETFEMLVDQVARNGRGWVEDLTCRRQDGKRISTEASAAIVDLPDSVYILASLRDITERKRREQALNVFNRVLRHNIRNDMNVILGRASLIEATVSDPTITDNAAQIEATARKLTAIGEKARLFQEIDERETDVDAVDLMGLVENVCSTLAADYDASFECRGPETAMAAVDPTVDIALSELCENAAKHATTPDSTVEIEITAAADDGYRVRITDEGPGLPPQDCAVLEGGTETPLNHGSGLGLWLANWVIDSNGGEIAVETSDETGTTVTVKFPAATAEQELRGVEADDD